MGGHGDHWGCIHEDYKGVISNLLPLTISMGKVVGKAQLLVEDPESGEKSEEIIFAIAHPQAGLRSMAVLITDTKNNHNKLWTAYPTAFLGTSFEVEIDQIHDWENYAEGLIEGSIFDGPLLCFFDTFYFQNKGKYKPEMKCTFALCAFAYSIKLYEHQEIEINNPEAFKLLHPDSQESGPLKVSFDGAKLLIQQLQGDKDDYSFQTTIEELEMLDFLGYPVYRLQGSFMTFEDQVLRLDVYAGEHVFEGFKPKIGDEIRGVLWLQGRLIEI